jgi:hypothetical protein
MAEEKAKEKKVERGVHKGTGKKVAKRDLKFTYAGKGAEGGFLYIKKGNPVPDIIKDNPKFAKTIELFFE